MSGTERRCDGTSWLIDIDDTVGAAYFEYSIEPGMVVFARCACKRRLRREAGTPMRQAERPQRHPSCRKRGRPLPSGGAEGAEPPGYKLVRYLLELSHTEEGGGIVPTLNSMGPAAGIASSAAPTVEAGGGGAHSFKLWGKDGFTFGDILDAINPLEQLPVVGTIYRHLTGHSISPASRIMGGALFGGPIGAALSALNAVVQATSGKAIGERVLEALEGTGAGAASERLASSVPPSNVFPSGRPADASFPPTQEASGVAALAQLQPPARPGGWMVNAAYGAAPQAERGTGVSTEGNALPLHEVASRAGQASPAVHRPRPGGWMVNAAYASVDAVERQAAAKVSASA